MPRAAKAATSVAKKPRAPKGHKLAENFPPGEILQDVFKKQWKLGPVIGQGGFGMIYMASNELSGTVKSDAPYVIKIEPKANGPLFCELHFYQRCCKHDMVDSWIRSHKLKYLGVPQYLGSGQHVRNGKEYRFMVMERFSTDLQKLFEKSHRFQPKTVLCLGLRMLDCLEYLHEHEYVHADIKASNMLMGYKNGRTADNEVYLVDYGLAYRYNVDKKHKAYQEDPKRVHDGTVEFTSRDAHKGVAPSRRGDLEILGYCLLQWLCGRLPWEDRLGDKDYVRDSKIKYMRNIPSLMKATSADGDAADAVSSFLSSIVKLDYDEKPNYTTLRQVLRRGLTKLGVKDEWKMDLAEDPNSITNPKPSTSKARKRKGDDSDAEVVTPKRKLVKPLANGHADSPSRVVSPAVSRVKSPAVQHSKPSPSRSKLPKSGVTSPKSKGSPSPAIKSAKRATSPKKSAKRATSPKKSATRTTSPKQTAKRRVRRKKVDTTDASIQTTPSLPRKR